MLFLLSPALDSTKSTVSLIKAPTVYGNELMLKQTPFVPIELKIELISVFNLSVQMSLFSVLIVLIL